MVAWRDREVDSWVVLGSKGVASWDSVFGFFSLVILSFEGISTSSIFPSIRHTIDEHNLNLKHVIRLIKS